MAALLAAAGMIWIALRPVDEPVPRLMLVPTVERVVVPSPPVIVRVSAPTPDVSLAPCPVAPGIPAPPAAPRMPEAQIAELANTEWGLMFDHFSDMIGGVASAPGRPELAYAVSHGDSGRATVYLSVDNGRSYRAVLSSSDDVGVGAMAIDCAGRLYVMTGATLGVREPDGTERWHGAPLDASDVPGQAWLATVGPWVLWSAGADIAASRDGGATWRSLGRAYNRDDGELVATGHALYLVRRACDADTVCLERLDVDGGTRASLPMRVDYAYGESGATAIAGSAGWSLHLRCPKGAYGEPVCASKVSADDLRWAALVAPDLLESEARTHHEIVCTQSTPNVCFLVASDRTSRRIVASAPPGYVAGVDGHGEPVATLYTEILRWSAARGWR